MRLIPFLILLILVFVGCGADHGPAPTTPNLPVWTADSQLLSQLQTPSSHDGYSMQIPADFGKEKQIRSNVYQPDGFAGKPREDGTRASIVVTIQKLQDFETRGTTSAGLVREAIDSIRSRRTNFVASDPEIGTIDGIEFAKINWSGTEPKMNIAAKGTMYCASTDERYITISVQDVADAPDNQLELAEAAVLTFTVK